MSGSRTETEAPAPEPISAGTEIARFSPIPLADTPAQPRTPAEASQGTGMATGEGDNSNRQAAVPPRCQKWLTELERYLVSRTGDLQPAEEHRINYLKDALLVGDEFCVIAHEFFVLWLVDADRCVELLGLPRPILYAACQVLEDALGGARFFRSVLLDWMVNFPFDLRSGDCPSIIAGDVTKFFRRLANKWGDLTDFVTKRRVPLRHRELLGILHLRSQTLRLALFRWSRRRLGVEITPGNANVIVALEEKFKEDQDFYMNLGHSEEEFQRHDYRLTVEYWAIVRAANIGEGQLQAAAARLVSGEVVPLALEGSVTMLTRWM